MNVDDLIKALQAVPNPSATAVTVDDSAGTALTTVDTSAVVEAGIEAASGGTVDLIGA